MTNIKKWMACIATGSILMLSLNSCKKLEDFGDTNVNPNQASDLLTSALLTHIQSKVSFPASTEAVGIGNNLVAGYFCQYFAEPTYPGSSRYSQPKINNSATYSGILMDVQTIIGRNTNPATAGLPNISSGGAAANQIATAMILKAFIFWTITDKWGDIPYSEALQGVSNLHPKYDEQFAIYQDLIADLKTANSTFDETGVLVRGDIIYSGNIAKWRKFANSLRMLMALRLSKRFPADGEYAATEFEDAMNDQYGHIELNADNFSVAYPGANYRNPWFSTGGSSDNGVSRTFTDILTGLNDTRINSMASNNNGAPYGYELAVPISNNYAKILAANFRTETSTHVIINAASIHLAKAEAAELGWIAGDPKAHYDMGVTRSFEQWNQTIPGAYLTTGPANFNTGAGVAVLGTPNPAGPIQNTPGANALTPTRLHRIALQQYLAFFPDGTQGWSNWRRSEYIAAVPDRGVPDIRPPVPNLSASGKIPRRFVYGTTDYSLNGDQLAIAVARLAGGDDQDSRVWWDKPL